MQSKIFKEESGVTDAQTPEQTEKKPLISKNLIQRIAVAAVGIPLLLWLCYEGGRWLQGLILVMTILAVDEFLLATFSLNSPQARKERFGAVAGPLTVSWIFATGICVAHLEWGAQLATLVYLCYFLVIGLVMARRAEAPAELFPALSSMSWGVFYVSMLYPFLYHVREFPGVDGFAWVVTLLATIWIGDTAAMWVGSTMGKTKLAPTVSPNKTVEGFLGDVVFSVIVGIVAGFVLFENTPILWVALGALVISIVGQLGDLVESLWKRSIGIKDSSRLIPGHGGVMDRFDSLAFAAPALYAYLLIITR